MSDDLTSTVFSALQALDAAHKATFLLDTALALIDAGKYGDEVERYLDVYLKTPKLPKTSIAKALLARANARKASGDRLLAQAQQDLQAVLRLDPSNRDVQIHLRRQSHIRFSHDPPSHRAPAEVWSRIATYIPRYHLRTWLFLSSFHRDIAVRHIFHTIDLYFGEDQPENVNRSLDVFDRVKADKLFASRIKCLRVHWAYEEGDLLDLMTRVFKTALPEFIALREFEWIGYPELRADMVQSVLPVHPNLQSLGLIGFHFDACGISSFRSLRKLTLRAEDDDGYADMSEITTALNNNHRTLTHLILGAYLHRQHSWDATFLSPTIHNLTHLDLVDTRISHTVLSRIAHAAGGISGRLESLTLHGILEEPGKAAVVFGSDEVINGEHTFLPRLKSFRFLLVGQPQAVVTPPPPPPPPQVQSNPYYSPHQPIYPQQQPQQQQYPPPHPQEQYGPDILQLYQTIAHFLRGRTQLRRLDLGSCPWDLVAPLLPGLTGLRVLGIRIGCVSRGCGISALGAGGGGGGSRYGQGMEEMGSEVEALVKSLPKQIGALRLEVGISEQPLYMYATQFTRFQSLSFLHLHLHTPPTPHQPHPHAHHTPQPHHHTHTHPLMQPHHPSHPHTPYPPLHHNQAQQTGYSHAQASGSMSSPGGSMYHAQQHQGNAAHGGPPAQQLQQQPGTPKRRVGKRDGVEHEGGDGENGGGGGLGEDHSGDNHVTGANAVPGPSQIHSSSTTMSTGSGTLIPHGLRPSLRVPPPLGHQQGQQQPLQVSSVHMPPLPPPAPLDNVGSAKYVAGAIPSLDFVGWNGELYVIVRGGSLNGNGNANAGTGASANVSADRSGDRATTARPSSAVPQQSSARASASPLLHPESATSSSTTTAVAGPSTSTDTTNTTTVATTITAISSIPPSYTSTPGPKTTTTTTTTNAAAAADLLPQPIIELKELPSRRRLDCGKGVDLGSEDAAWLERKDVPMDYDMPVVPE